MKKIGEGFYYKVFDLGNGRVLKKQMSFFSRMMKLLVWKSQPVSVLDLFRRKKFQQRFEASLTDSKEVMKVVPMYLLGNPTFINDHEYEQDKALPLIDAIKTSSDDVFFCFANEYVALQKILWAHGYADHVYNFTLNCGIDERTHKVILIDFNDMTRSKEKVLKNITNKKWNTQMSLRDFPRAELKEHISRLFENEFTNQEVETLWNTKN